MTPATLSVGDEMEKWQTMDSAPKDGTWVLLWWPYWSPHAIMAYFDGGSWSSEGVLSDHEEPGPEAWMPLPPPPLKPIIGREK
jgi:hypothetical protein